MPDTGPKKPKVGDKLNVPYIYDLVMPVSNTKSMSNTMCLSPTLGFCDNESSLAKDPLDLHFNHQPKVG